MKKTIPAISIIIPMYNVEKYIGECLDSILAQTFQDYEVIVVDDCSTDKSFEIVESYIPKFNKDGSDRLLLLHTKKNVGVAGLARNVGIRVSCGEYLMFVDSDDAITPTALEELYPIAKKFDSDFIYSEKWYELPENNLYNDKNAFKEVGTLGVKNFVTEPTLQPENLAERIKIFCEYKIHTPSWGKLFRRKMITENDIKFPPFRHGEDEFFNFCVLCASKNIVSIPNKFYIWRLRGGSMMHGNLSVEEYIKNWYGSFFKAIGFYDEFMKNFELFRKNPDCKYRIFEKYTQVNVMRLPQIYGKIPVANLDEFVRKALENVDDKTALTAFLFNRMNVFNLELMKRNATIQQMNAHIQKQSEIIKQLQARIESLQK